MLGFLSLPGLKELSGNLFRTHLQCLIPAAGAFSVSAAAEIVRCSLDLVLWNNARRTMWCTSSPHTRVSDLCSRGGLVTLHDGVDDVLQRHAGVRLLELGEHVQGQPRVRHAQLQSLLHAGSLPAGAQRHNSARTGASTLASEHSNDTGGP